MYTDAQLQFSNSQAITTDAVGTNVLDLALNRSIGNGKAMCVMFVVDVAADQTSGDEDYAFELEYATDAPQTTGRQQVGERLFESGTPDAPAQNADLLVAGFTFFLPVPPTKLSESARYLGIRYNTTGTSPIITMSAWLMPQDQVDATNDHLSGFTVV